MTSARLPVVIETLLYEHIESYEQLEILLLLRLESTEKWTAARICDRLNLSAALVSGALGALSANGLLASHDDWTRCHYAPRTPALDDAVTQLALAYSVQRLEIVKLMTANAIKRMRTGALTAFAEAFVLHKDQD